MKSDVIKVTNSGDGIEDALLTASASARYRGLARKEELHLRLLAEEMLGTMRQITKDAEAEFYVGSEGKNFELHLEAKPSVTGNMRRELLKVATSGKNEAAKGFTGKLRDIFNRALAPEGTGDLSDYYAQGLILPPEFSDAAPLANAMSSSVMMWSMRKYMEAVKNENSSKAKEEWDELEKSIVANVADEVKIAITGNKVEMTVYKKF